MCPCVIRDATAADNVLGVSRLVIGRRERAVVLEPCGEGIVLWTLRFGDEVRPEESYFEDIDEEADPELVPLVQQLIKQRTKKWSPSMMTDPLQESVLTIIAEKKTALRPRGSNDEPTSNVINIVDALRKSMEAELRGKNRLNADVRAPQFVS